MLDGYALFTLSPITYTHTHTSMRQKCIMEKDKPFGCSRPPSTGTLWILFSFPILGIFFSLSVFALVIGREVGGCFHYFYYLSIWLFTFTFFVNLLSSLLLFSLLAAKPTRSTINHNHNHDHNHNHNYATSIAQHSTAGLSSLSFCSLLSFFPFLSSFFFFRRWQCPARTCWIGHEISGGADGGWGDGGWERGE